MKKFLVVMFVMVSLVVVSCGKGGSTGFATPDELAAKIVSLKPTMEKGNLGVITDLYYFEKAEDKVKVESYFSLMEEIYKEMMKANEAPKATEDKFNFKEAKVEGTKGELFFDDGSNMKIVSVDGKWYLSIEDELIQQALNADIEEMKKNLEKVKNAPKGE